MAYDENLAERISKILKGKRGLVQKKMFGGIAYMLKDKMFIGIAKNKLMVRVLNEKYEDILKKPHASEMDFTGRLLKGYLFISEEGIKAEKQLAKWIELGIEYALKSPPKKKASVKKKTIKKRV